jgi:chromosome segregation protein
MVLKRVQLHGFKSFCDKTVLDLEPGVTAIVGPNGCGKSNIVDAVRWVLGEQSVKALRGTRFEDMIFNGTEDRPPLGYVEVTLTLDNTGNVLPVDYDEVSVTRRTFRSGETEYLINKTKCRLKDVLELFMDTGIGPHAYSLISQGQVEALLSAKPEERRALFDEAAGIAKYKARRRIALRKLEAAENNLLRLGDVIHEVARQMRSLKRQVGAATRYNEYEKELRELEIREAFGQYVCLTGQEKNLNSAISEVQTDRESAVSALSVEEAAREQLGVDLLECDRHLLASRESVHALDSQMDKLEAQRAVLNERLKMAGEKKQRAAEDAARFRSTAGEMDKELESVEKKRRELFAKSEETRGKAAEKQTALAQVAAVVEEGERAVDQYRSTVAQAADQRAAVAARVENIGANIRAIEARVRGLAERETSVKDRLATCTSARTKSKAAIRKSENVLRRLDQKRKSVRETLSDKVGRRNALEFEFNTAREQRAEKNSRLESLRELRDSYEGFLAGARAILVAKKRRETYAKGVIGPLAELIRVEKRYEAAVEAALGEYVQAIIVKSAADVERCIDVLNRTEAGRATFVSLEAANRYGAKVSSDRKDGRASDVLNCADLVESEDEYRGLVRVLAGDCAVVETLRDVTKVNLDGYRCVVTLEGEIVRRCGAVTAGRSGMTQAGLLGRGREITELERTVTGLDTELDGHRDALERFAREIADLEQTLFATESEHEKQQAELVEMRRELYRYDEEKKRYEAELAALAADRSDLAKQIEDLEQNRNEATELLAAAEQQTKDYAGRVDEERDKLSERRAELRALADEITELKVTLTTVEQAMSGLESERARIAKERRDLEKRAGESESETQHAVESMSVLSRELKQIEQSSQEVIREKSAAQKAVTQDEQGRQSLLEKINLSETALKEKRARCQQLQERCHRLEIELSHITERIQALRGKTQSEHSTDLAALTPEQVGTDDFDEEQRAQRVATLKRRVQLMGPVNLRAIEEHNELKERHEFLVAQQKDLVKAKESLLDVIRKINETAEAMFMETFSAVRANFHEMFRRLFNGGMARLSLADEADVLESGIDIEVRPPGKRLQSISLLSGGESTLTAIALLFSIFKAKRSPFCVLDEVDAALDEANTGRFLELLDQYSEDTQFVIITHNKRTMERASVLYGVTMQERGVSQIVSVRLREEAFA